MNKPIKWTLKSIRALTSHIAFQIFGQKLYLSIEEDKRFKDPVNGRRIYLQWYYDAPCTKSGEIERWKGGKYYLTEFMTDDEIVKKAWAAAQAVVHHEVMEGFTFNDIVLFNPHVNFRELLTISHKEITRPNNFDM